MDWNQIALNVSRVNNTHRSAKACRIKYKALEKRFKRGMIMAPYGRIRDSRVASTRKSAELGLFHGHVEVLSSHMDSLTDSSQ